MQKIRFLNHENESERAIFYCGYGLEQPDKTVKLKFKEEIPSDEILCCGFDILNENTNENISDDYYHGYTTIYRRFDDEMTIQLSKDGSVYVEPEIIEPEPYEPTEEELQAIFENNKKAKISQSKSLLSTYLENHPLVSDCHGGIEAEYNVTTEKQNLMTSHYATYTIEKNLGLNPVLKWNSTGAECEEWTEEEFIQLILEVKAYVEPLVSLQQSYEVAIRNCTTQEELDAIEIVYDVYGIAE